LAWSFQAGAPIIAPPITYRAGNIQYISVLTGPGTSAALIGKPMEPYARDYHAMQRRVLTFAIGGNAVLPETVVAPVPLPDDPTYAAQPESGLRGEMTYLSNCAVCHGYNVISSGFAPDLRKSFFPLSAEGFAGVVKEGLLLSNGMPKFGEFKPDQLQDLRQYIRSQADLLRQQHLAQRATADESGAGSL
jgi:quinohemoprotein ethanol dehydrogenase